MKIINNRTRLIHSAQFRRSKRLINLNCLERIRKVLGTKKTIVYVALVILYSTIAGLIFGLI